MKPESLHALLIDRELGELAPETAELLEAWLADHPESAAVVESTRRTLKTTSAAVRRFPQLVWPQPNVISLPTARFRLVPLALAASFVLLLGSVAWLGFHAVQQSTHKTVAGSHQAPVPAPAANTVKPGGPWARYALISDPRGGLTVARRDPNSQF